jgi:hypothetical protein
MVKNFVYDRAERAVEQSGVLFQNVRCYCSLKIEEVDPRGVRQTSPVLFKDRLQIHFQRRVCDLENSASALAEPFVFGHGVGAL